MGLFGIIIVLGVIGVASTAGWLVWLLFVRPFAVSHGMIPVTAYDHLVRGWKAERQGRWTDALTEYEHAIKRAPRDPDARFRRDALLAAHPELLNS